MKFRRNNNDEKIFKLVSIISVFAAIILLIVAIVILDIRLIGLVIGLFLVSVMYFYISRLLRNSFIEFLEDKIIFINGKNNNTNIVINICDIEKILLPSEVAFRKNIKNKPIIIRHKEQLNSISYSEEIKNYIKEHFNDIVEYYDNYSSAIKS